MDKFKAGDVVRVKGQPGPKMTVERQSDEGICCVWFTPGPEKTWYGPSREKFAPGALEKA